MKVLDQQILLSRYEHGRDYGTSRPVLAFKKANGESKVLYKWPGSKYWSSRGRYKYAKQSFVLGVYDQPSWRGIKTTPLWEGRFTKAKLKEYASKIAAFFEVTEAEVMQISDKTTIELGETNG